MTPDVPPGTDVPAILHRLADHLSTLAADVSTLEDALAEQRSDGTFAKQNAIKPLQKIDFLRQSLEDCARLGHGLGKVTTGAALQQNLTTVLGKDLMLGSTRALLGAPSGTASPQGDVDLF